MCPRLDARRRIISSALTANLFPKKTQLRRYLNRIFSKNQVVCRDGGNSYDLSRKRAGGHHTGGGTRSYWKRIQQHTGGWKKKRF